MFAPPVSRVLSKRLTAARLSLYFRSGTVSWVTAIALGIGVWSPGLDSAVAGQALPFSRQPATRAEVEQAFEDYARAAGQTDKVSEADVVQRKANVDRMYKPFIVGGEESAPGRWPFAAAVTLKKTDGTLALFCGGTLITPEWILTAAHCKVRRGDKIILGRHNLSDDGGEIIDAGEVFMHKEYNPATKEWDIALVQLTRRSAQPSVGLVAASEVLPSQSIVVGWGQRIEGGVTSSSLHQVALTIVANELCRNNGAAVITGGMLCAGEKEGGKDACYGDSGGPLLITDGQQRWKQAGIVSFGLGCGKPDRYGVYTRVAAMLSWIKERMQSVPKEGRCTEELMRKNEC